MINKEWPLSGQRQCRTNSTKLEETDQENKILSVMDIILTVMCRGHLECQKKVCKQVIKYIS